MDSRLRGNDGREDGKGSGEGNDSREGGGFEAPATGGFDAPTTGGFDVILGNPPYVRQELFTHLKPYLQQHYDAYHGVADLYVYFYELGLNKLLATGGRLGYISSSSFFKTSSGEPLRRLLRQHGQIETLVDFGDWQVFDGVTTYPAIVVLQKYAADDSQPASFLQLTAAVPDLAATFEESKQSLNLAQLSGGEGTAVGEAAEWQLEGNEASALRAKLMGGKEKGHPSLKQAVGSPYRGVLTGLNEAFVINRATRDKLVFADPESSPLFKPFLEGKDIKRWQVESEDRWLILMPKGWTKQAINSTLAGVNTGLIATEAVAFEWLQTRHPQLAAYLAPFADAARKRTDKGDYWWELRACAYYGKFDEAKILYPDISQGGKFCFDKEGQFFGNTAYFVQTEQAWLAALFNSRVVWFYLSGVCEALRGGEWRLRMFTQQIETLPIPPASAAQQTELSHLATACAQAAQERLAAQRGFGRRILDLLPTPAPKGAQASLGDKLGSWWLLEDFKAFQFEVNKRFKTEIPLRERNDWEHLFTQERSRIHQLNANIAATERSIDAIVYTLFGLNRAEIALVERSVQR